MQVVSDLQMESSLLVAVLFHHQAVPTPDTYDQNQMFQQINQQFPNPQMFGLRKSDVHPRKRIFRFHHDD